MAGVCHGSSAFKLVADAESQEEVANNLGKKKKVSFLDITGIGIPQRLYCSLVGMNIE